MTFQLKRLERNSLEVQDFHDKFCKKIKYDIPTDYFNTGDCFGMYVDALLVGGFCLVDAPPLHLRSITQIQDVLYNWHTYDKILYDACEFTGYFLDGKKFGFVFTMYLVWTVLFYRAKQFVYSYPVSHKGLERYYGHGNPIRIHTGIPSHQEGIKGAEREHVEVLTKWGIVKIFLCRTLRYISWRYYERKTQRP